LSGALVSKSIFKHWLQVIGSADAFKNGEECAIVSDDNSNDDVEKTFELQYYLNNDGVQALPDEVVVKDVTAYKATLTTYPVLHIVA
jgi:hypothetical protein